MNKLAIRTSSEVKKVQGGDRKQTKGTQTRKYNRCLEGQREGWTIYTPRTPKG